MGKNSIIWQLWNEISFSRSRITFGSVNKRIKEEAEKSPLVLLQCGEHNEREKTTTTTTPPPSFQNGLCTVNASLEYSGRVFRNLEVVIDPTFQDIILPSFVYDLITFGMDIYNQDEESWSSFDLVFKEGITETSLLKSHSPMEVEHFTKEMTITVKPEKFVKDIGGGKKDLVLKRGDETTHRHRVTLGTESLKNLIIHKNRSGYMTIQNFITFDSISATNLILFAIQVVLWLRWKILHLELLKETKTKRKATFLNTFTRLLGIAITITSVALPQNQMLLGENEPLFYGTIALVAFSLLLELPFLLSFQQVIKFDVEKYLTHFEYNLISSFSHEVLLLTGMWVLILQERVEGTGGPFLLVLNVLLLYSVSSYLVMTTHYLLEEFRKCYCPTINVVGSRQSIFYLKRDSTISKQFLLVSSFIALIYIYQVIVTFQIFLKPTILDVLNFTKELKTIFLVGLYVVVFVIATSVNNLLLGVAVRRERKKNESGMYEQGKFSGGS